MKTYLVGGAVRDRLMGIEPKDRDYVVVGSTPEEMISLGYKSVGESFPVFLSETGDEYALARTEVSTGPSYTDFEVDFSPDSLLNKIVVDHFIKNKYDLEKRYSINELIKIHQQIIQ